jgi:hypothetical protein
MWVEDMVWGAYLELLDEMGTRMSRLERQELALHRRYVQAGARLVEAFDGDAEQLWTLADLFRD